MSEPGCRRFSRRIRAVVLLAGAASLAGCLTAEVEDEVFTLRENRTRGAYSIVLYNVQSDGPTPHHQQEDFKTMVEVLTSEDYLLDRLRGGLYVKKRGVTVEKGMLVARESGLFSDPSNVGMMMGPDSTMHRRVNQGSQVLETNGRVIQQGDSTYIRWPKNLREFKVKTHVSSFHPTASLVGKYRAWKAKKP